MAHAPIFQNIDEVDLAAIELEARKLRAEAALNFFQSVKAAFAGLSFGSRGQRAGA